MAHKDVEKVVSEVLAGLPHSVAEEHIRRGGVRAYQFLEANQALLKVLQGISGAFDRGLLRLGR
jgi:hypothetical protein